MEFIAALTTTLSDGALKSSVGVGEQSSDLNVRFGYCLKCAEVDCFLTSSVSIYIEKTLHSIVCPNLWLIVSLNMYVHINVYFK